MKENTLTVNSRFLLSNQVRMPVIGFGTCEMGPWEDRTEEMLYTVVEAGYRMFDTAPLYHTERALGNVMKSSGLSREEFFISSKVWSWDIRRSPGDIMRTFADTLRMLQTDYLDALIMHWPVQGRMIEAYKVMELLYESGMVRSIGLSNATRFHFMEIMQTCDIVPHIQQDECNPTRANLYNRIFDERYGIRFQSFMPTGMRHGASDHWSSVFDPISQKYGKAYTQIALRWAIQQGISPIPRTFNPEHIRSNIDIFDFELTEEEMKSISTVNTETQRNYDVYNFVL
jgi:diketogulonate reductase-like aldo/keto reductase